MAANNPPRRKRRRVATGHGVQQIPETSTVLLPPQQQQQPTLPPIEHRHVAEQQAVATASFAGAEPTETDRPEPAAAVAEALAADEPMAIEAGLAAEEDLIANFLPQHRKEIRQRLDDEGIQQVLNEARSFLKMLKDNGIKLNPGRGRIPTPSVFGRLKNLSVTKDAEIIRKFFEKATIFFSAVNPAQTKNTGCLSTMLNANTHITNFANETEDNLRLLAGNPYLKQITSMCSRRGVPDPVKVAEIIEWDCWKIDGTFSLELFRAFSSMQSGRGLINDQAQVVEMLAWECWQPDGEFSMELLRAVSSMMSRRGFPDKDTLTAMLAWDCWKIDGKFSMELLRIFSSMMNSCGIPQKEKVEAILAWPCWQVDGKFSFDLLRTFSSMSHGKGLIKQAEVERVLAWPCWQVNGKFSLNLLRIFSSMSSSRGLLKDEARINAILAWDCWKIDGEFRIDLLRTFSSMFHGRGLIKQEEVERVLAWPCWQLDGKFSLRLMGVFSSMMSAHGIPEQADVEALLAWPCCQVDGKVSIDRLHILAVMMHSRGMPDQATAEAFLAWLPSRTETSDKGHLYLRIACRTFAKTSIPDPEVLADIEAALRPYFTEEIADDEHSSDSEDKLSEMRQLKALTLFCAASAKWQRNLNEIQKYLAACNTTSRSQTVVHTIMDSLLQILANHGQAGVRLWLEHYSRQPDSRSHLSAALSISAPFALAKFALKKLPEPEWQDYIALCKNLIPTPDKEQWQALKPLRDLLNKRFSLTLRKRMMLEILWPQSEHNRLRYAEKLDTLLNTVPTIYQLYRLHQAFKPQKLQAFLDACLARKNMAGQSINEAVPEIKTQEILLEGLLLGNHYLSDHGQIPKLCFSKQTADAGGSGVIVDGDAEMSGRQRLWHFIAAMLIELKQTEYQFNQQQLRISPSDGETIILPKPEFTGMNTGFVITNWSSEQLTAFFQVTEFTDHWYRNPNDTGNSWVTRGEQRLQQMRARPQNITQTGYKAGSKSSRSLLPPSVIMNIIKQGIRLKPAVWSSLEHYAKSGQLSDTLCRILAPIIEKELASTAPDAIPEIVKKTVAKRLRKTGTSQTAAEATATQLPSSTSTFAATPSPFTSPFMSPSQMLPATDIAIDMALDTMARDMAIEELEHFPVLGRAELDMLEPLRDQMTYSQLINVMTKINLQSVEPETVAAWQQAFENRRRDNLDLDLDELFDSFLEEASD